MANRANNNEVLEVTDSRPGEGVSKLNEHPPAVVLGRDDQDSVGRQHRVEVRRGELGGDHPV